MKKNKDETNLNFIEDAAREMGGRDDESLLRQMEKARQEWEREKRENPEEAAAVERSADQQFAAIMARLKAENAQPVSREEYEKRKKEGEKERERENGRELPVREAGTAEEIKSNEESGNDVKVVKVRKKKYRKVVVIAAVAAVLMVGMSVVAIGRPEYHTVYPEDLSGRNVRERYNSNIAYHDTELEKTYQNLKDTLEISVMTLGYIPKGMKYEEAVINNQTGVLKFSYGDQWLYLKEKKNQIEMNVEILVSDRKFTESIQNDWIGQELPLEENILDNGTVEYSINYETEEASYYLSGIVEKSVFVEIAEELIIIK